MRLTDRQRWYLTLASAKPASTADLREGRQFVEWNETLDACYHTLARMRRRGLLRLEDGLWHVTEGGTAELTVAA